MQCGFVVVFFLFFVFSYTNTVYSKGSAGRGTLSLASQALAMSGPPANSPLGVRRALHGSSCPQMYSPPHPIPELQLLENMLCEFLNLFSFLRSKQRKMAICR